MNDLHETLAPPTQRCLFESAQRVWLVQASADGAESARDYVRRERDALLSKMSAYGAVLLRGFDVPDAVAFEDVARAVDDELLDYRYGSSPRTRARNNVFTSTEYPSAELIPLHNEMSYTTEWPRRIWFFSELCAQTDGQTPLADSHRVFESIPVDVRERFMAKGVRYVRNYTGTFDLSWQKTFQTESREQVQAYCASRGIQVEWLDEDHLRTVENCQAAWRHPDDGRWLWLNQAHLFHVSNLKPELRALMEDCYAPDELPRNAMFGDGTPIPDADLDAIRQAYDAHMLSFTWERGDLLLVDNLAMAHGRNRFTGERRVLVAMADPFDSLKAA
jgi:alpha-ketoglutarate-dependent taurine dioxygenase